MNSKSPQSRQFSGRPEQRKTTLKWSSDGELSSVDMARILENLSKPELTQCDLTCNLNDSDNIGNGSSVS